MRRFVVPVVVLTAAMLPLGALAPAEAASTAPVHPSAQSPDPNSVLIASTEEAAEVMKMALEAMELEVKIERAVINSQNVLKVIGKPKPVPPTGR